MSIVLTEDRGSVRHIVMNRPEKRNAMNDELIDGARRGAARRRRARWLGALRGAARRRPDVLLGHGLRELVGRARGRTRAAAGLSRGGPRRMEPLRRDDQADDRQIHGGCIGGAMELALGVRPAHDGGRRRASGSSRREFGLIPDVGGCSRLSSVVGLGRAKEMIMTSKLDRWHRGRAHRPGQPRRPAPTSSTRPPRRSSGELLACAPLAVGLAKRVIDASARPALAATLEHGGHDPGAVRRERRLRRGCAARSPRSASRSSPEASASAIGPAISVWLPSGRPRISCTRPAQASSAGRSMPVAMPISWSIETRSSVAMLPVAPARHGTAAQLAEARLEAVDPRLERGEHVREPLAAGVVKMRGQLRDAAAGPPRRSRAAVKNRRT